MNNLMRSGKKRFNEFGKFLHHVLITFIFKTVETGRFRESVKCHRVECDIRLIYNMTTHILR